MEYANDEVEVMTFPSWLTECLLDLRDGTEIGEITANGSVHVKKAPDGKPTTFEAAVTREGKSTYVFDAQASDTTSSSHKKRVNRVSHFGVLRPSADDVKYKSLLAERKQSAINSEPTTKAVDNVPQAKIITKVMQSEPDAKKRKIDSKK